MKKVKLLLASSNKGKIAEFKGVAKQFAWVELLAPVDLDQGSGPEPEVEENGATYEENSALKAKAYFAWGGLPALADDTGLEVDALNGEPGLYSARYAGEPSNPQRNIEKLLKALEHKPRTARFVCVLTLQLSEDRIQTVRADLLGSITETPTGAGGFGYDSVFIPQGQTATLAELKSRAAEIDTHRTLAAKKLFTDLSHVV